MANEVESVWLGSARKPMRTIMLVSVGLTSLMSLWLIFGRMFLGTGIGLKQFLSPTETPSVFLTMIIGSLALFFACLYFSDTRGAIESEPSGFFDIVSLICARLSMIATCLVVFVMFYEVVSRYVFVKPALWANELSL